MTSTLPSSGLARPGKDTGGAGVWAAADALHMLPAPRISELPAARTNDRRSVSIRLPLFIEDGAVLDYNPGPFLARDSRPPTP
jgi:hypothetical protein